MTLNCSSLRAYKIAKERKFKLTYEGGNLLIFLVEGHEVTWDKRKELWSCQCIGESYGEECYAIRAMKMATNLKQKLRMNDIIDFGFKLKKNCFVMNDNESENHTFLKYKVCERLKSLNLDFFTECVLMNGRRVDVLVPEREWAVEVVVTEKEESLIAKSKNYLGLKIIPIRTINDIDKLG